MSGGPATSGAPPVVLAVVGATATGKSDVAVGLCEALGGEAVNADSMQLYEGMDVGTAKLTVRERRGVPHHLLDVWPVTRPAAVAEYQELARAAFADVAGRGRLPVLVGGSGLYVRAALDDLRFPGTDPDVRARLSAEAEEVGAPAMHERLRRVDPAAAAAILPGNVRRVVRALEVVEITGRPFSAAMPEPGARARAVPAVVLGLRRERPDVDRRIAERVDRMWRDGLVDEVRSLRERGLAEGPTASRAVGYAQVLELLAGRTGDDEAREATVRATRRLVRRQESWFGADPDVLWLDVAADDTAAALTERARALVVPRLRERMGA
ncbi:tRNA (adenosine(37)-N6)-dimethylallyltransferase MiaA [Aquipuribacter sp. SD81]|uniref:tRNA (adenosine(37)-N6)-dimethylallyltransferase MiaA n=1 Tax=Aquipuribacter sp. SD81 TaxID=3127703 RepID=UPI003015E777